MLRRPVFDLIFIEEDGNISVCVCILKVYRLDVQNTVIPSDGQMELQIAAVFGRSYPNSGTLCSSRRIAIM